MDPRIILRAALVCLTVLSAAVPAGVHAQAPGRVFTVGLKGARPADLPVQQVARLRLRATSIIE